MKTFLLSDPWSADNTSRYEDLLALNSFIKKLVPYALLLMSFSGLRNNPGVRRSI